jgi:hypothetical protein
MRSIHISTRDKFWKVLSFSYGQISGILGSRKAKMGQDILYFFEGKPEALPLYEAFEQKVFSWIDSVKVS